MRFLSSNRHVFRSSHSHVPFRPRSRLLSQKEVFAKWNDVSADWEWRILNWSYYSLIGENVRWPSVLTFCATHVFLLIDLSRQYQHYKAKRKITKKKKSTTTEERVAKWLERWTWISFTLPVDVLLKSNIADASSFLSQHMNVGRQNSRIYWCCSFAKNCKESKHGSIVQRL